MYPLRVCDDPALLGDGDGSKSEITSNHEEPNSGTAHRSDGRWNISSRRVDDAHKADDGELLIELGIKEFGEVRVIESRCLFEGGTVDDPLGEE